MPELKLAVCIPSGDMVHMDFAASLGVMLAQLAARQVPSVLINEKSAVLQRSRQTLVNRALSQEASHLLFLDSDMIFPPDTALRLLAHKVDIVGVAAAKRRPPFTPSALTLQGEPLVFSPGDGLVEAGSIGLAGTLIRAEVFRQIGKPWFPVTWQGEDDSGADLWTGEDYGFCEKVRQAGLQISVDAQLSYQFGHLGQRRFALDRSAGS